LVAIVDTLFRSLPRALTSSTTAMLGTAVTLSVDMSDDGPAGSRPPVVSRQKASASILSPT